LPQLESLTSQLAHAQHEADAHRQRVHELQAHVHARDSNDVTRLDGLTRDNSTLRAAVAELEATVAREREARAAVGARAERAEHFETRLVEERARHEALQEHASDIEGKLLSVTAVLSEVRDDAAARDRELSSAVKALKVEKRGLERALAEAESGRDEESRRRSALEVCCERLSGELDAARAELKEVR
jgi:chromosome segregation ATPase